jgi:hypothetical protein
MADYDADVFRRGGGRGYDEDVFSSPEPLEMPREPRSRNEYVDAANALGTGAWRGVARLAGLPVDTVANVRDLVKSAVGVPYIAATGKVPPEWLQVRDRSKDVGSGDWLISLLRRTPMKAMIDPANPEFEGGYLQAMGSGASAAMVPGGLAQTINRGLLGAGSGASSKAALDLTGSPELAIAAGMVPLLGQHAAEGTIKRGLRGGEQGRQNMQRRVYQLEDAGITDPTLGLATGNRLVGGVENLLQSTPGAVGRMQSTRQRIVDQLANKAHDAAAMASPVRGAHESGVAIQAGAKGFKEGFKERQRQLYDRLDQHIPSGAPSNVDATMQELRRLNEGIPGAPNTSELFRNGRIRGIEEAMQRDLDLAGAPTLPPGAKSQIPVGEATYGVPGTLPYEAVKKTRTLVGNELADNSLLSDVPRSKWSSLYGALSDDLQRLAAETGPQASSAYRRANDYTRAGVGRLERIAPFVNRDTPEQSFTSLSNTFGENVSAFQAVKKSLPPGARGTVAGTVIERLGKAPSGQQNASGDVWSADRFLTSWNRMTPKARNELFSGFPNSDQVRKDVEAVAAATSMMRDNSKLWANPSGTGANMVARAALLGAPASFFLNPWAPAGVGGLLGANYMAGRAVTSKNVRNFLLEPDVRMGLMGPTNARSLAATGLLVPPEGEELAY